MTAYYNITVDGGGSGWLISYDADGCQVAEDRRHHIHQVPVSAGGSGACSVCGTKVDMPPGYG